MLIYKITNLINGKVYIGATTMSLRQRMQSHFYTSRREDYPICQVIRKYGEDNFKFQVIEIEPNKEIMHEREKYYIKLYDSMNNGYNGTSGGSNCEFSDRILKKLSKSQLKRYGGNTRTPETIEKIRQTKLEYYKNNPDIRKGKNNPNYKGNN